MPWLALAGATGFIVSLLLARFGQRRAKAAGFVLAGVLGLAIGFGLIKGFGRISAGPLSLNADKLFIGISLALILPSPWRWNRACWAWLGLALGSLPLLAWLSGFVHWQPALSWPVLWFIVGNLPSCIAEDFFFRRFVQDHLHRLGKVGEILLTATLFGLAHLGGGPLFAMLALLAGVYYSAVYRASGNSVWAVTGVHWLVNIARFVLFGLP
ncbi:lysostaphin resistance A-like protein [Chitinimonas sp.]|uniref:CPBP family intramembrane glutamic endopeptidase n=1 Tax=Chitinimonas sp. TaxID=1934313 RepID=UPI0035B1BCB2